MKKNKKVDKTLKRVAKWMKKAKRQIHSALEAAKSSGDALLNARARLPDDDTFWKFVRQEFVGGVDTAKVYIWLSKNWDRNAKVICQKWEDEWLDRMIKHRLHPDMTAESLEFHNYETLKTVMEDMNR